MGNIKTCVDTSRIRTNEDNDILEAKFDLLGEARKHLIDPETGNFRTMAEAIEIAKKRDSSK